MDIFLEQIISLDDVNNLIGPYRDMVSSTSSYELRIKKTYIQNLVIINNFVCDFNKSLGFIFPGNICVVLMEDRNIYYGELEV